MGKKGIVLAGLIYTLLVFFLLLLASIVVVLWNRQNAIDFIKGEANSIFKIVRFDDEIVEPEIIFRTFGGSSSELFYDLTPYNNGFVASGYSQSTDGDLTGLAKGLYDGIIVKYDENTNVLWKKTFGGSSIDWFYGLTQVSDGYIAVGNSWSNDGDLTGLNKGGYGDAIIVKYDVNGNKVWNKNYGGISSETFYQVIETTDGYIAVGTSDSNDQDLAGLNKGGQDAIIVKHDLNGNVVWKKNYGGLGSDIFSDILKVTDGYIAVGQSSSTDQDLVGLNKGGQDAIIVKYDLNGNVVWKKNYGGALVDNFRSIGSLIDGYLVVGWSLSNDQDLVGLNKGFQDAIIVKYDLNGNVVWKKNYGGTNTDWFYGITTINDSFIATGYSNSTDGDLTGLNKGGDDCIVVKYDSNGEIIWNRNYGGALADLVYTITAINRGYIAVGMSSSTDGDLTGLNKGGQDAFVIKIVE